MKAHPLFPYLLEKLFSHPNISFYFSSILLTTLTSYILVGGISGLGKLRQPGHHKVLLFISFSLRPHPPRIQKGGGILRMPIHFPIGPHPGRPKGGGGGGGHVPEIPPPPLDPPMHTVELKPVIRAHFSGKLVSSSVSDVVIASVHSEKPI